MWRGLGHCHSDQVSLLAPLSADVAEKCRPELPTTNCSPSQPSAPTAATHPAVNLARRRKLLSTDAFRCRQGRGAQEASQTLCQKAPAARCQPRHLAGHNSAHTQPSPRQF